jgi:hypothetical protein
LESRRKLLSGPFCHGTMDDASSSLCAAQTPISLNPGTSIVSCHQRRRRLATLPFLSPAFHASSASPLYRIKCAPPSSSARLPHSAPSTLLHHSSLGGGLVPFPKWSPWWWRSPRVARRRRLSAGWSWPPRLRTGPVSSGPRTAPTRPQVSHARLVSLPTPPPPL